MLFRSVVVEYLFQQRYNTRVVVVVVPRARARFTRLSVTERDAHLEWDDQPGSPARECGGCGLMKRYYHVRFAPPARRGRPRHCGRSLCPLLVVEPCCVLSTPRDDGKGWRYHLLLSSRLFGEHARGRVDEARSFLAVVGSCVHGLVSRGQMLDFVNTK